MKRIVFAVLAVFLLIGGIAAKSQAQSRQLKLVACPENMIPAEYKNYKRWDKDHAGLMPLIPNFDPAKAHRYLVGLDGLSAAEKASMSDREKADVIRGHARLMGVFALQAFTPAGTDQKLAPKEPPLEFQKRLATEEIEVVKVPCGKTVFNQLSWAAEDTREGAPQYNVEPQPMVLAFAESGVFTDAGEPAIRVVQFKHPIPIESGPNKGSLVQPICPVVCFNCDIRLGRVTEQVEAPAVAPPAPTVQVGVAAIRKVCHSNSGVDLPDCKGMPLPAVFFLTRLENSFVFTARTEMENGAFVARAQLPQKSAPTLFRSKSRTGRWSTAS